MSEKHPNADVKNKSLSSKNLEAGHRGQLVVRHVTAVTEKAKQVCEKYRSATGMGKLTRTRGKEQKFLEKSEKRRIEETY